MIEEKKANLFIVGAAKAGTTTIYNHLASHPEICMSFIKEPNYFTAEPLQKNRLYYREAIVLSAGDYQKQFKPLPGQHLIGEASVSYLFYPGTAEKIFQYNSESKIIILLRDPANRAFSHYLMDKKLGLVKNSFGEIINEGNKPGVLANYFQQYISYGLYYKQVYEYIKVFPQNQVLIILFEELQESPAEVLFKISNFLQLHTWLEILADNKFNEASTPVGRTTSFLYQIRFIRKLLKTILPESISGKIKKRFFANPAERLSPEQKEWLNRYYRNDIKELEKLIQKNLSAWYE